MLVPKLFHLILVIWYIFSNVLSAYDLSVPQQPNGPLGVTLDYSFAKSWPTADTSSTAQRNWMYSSHLTFKQPVSAISNGQLWQIALDAYNEIPAVMAQYGISKRKGNPSAMTVLAFGNEIILASSLRGGNHFTYEFGNGDTPVGKALQLCQAIWRDATNANGDDVPIHQNQGHCGELMVAHLYYALHKTSLADQKARVATVVFKNPTPPCGTDREDTWGCNLFVKEMSLTDLDVNTGFEPYDLSTLAGGNPVKDQIPLCSTPIGS